MTFQHLKPEDFVTVVREPGDGKELKMALPGTDDTISFKVTGEETAGTLAFLEYAAAPGSAGSKPHTHDAHEEAFYVLDGPLRMRIGDEIRDVPSGGFAFVPRGVVHGFWNPTAKPVRFIGAWTPAGFERLFEERNRLAAERELTPDDIERLARKYGVRYVALLPGEGE